MADDKDNDAPPLTQREEAMLRELQARKDAEDEIERRRQALASQDQAPGVDQDQGSPGDLSLTPNNYRFAIVNKAHRSLNPPCERPAFRILGLFQSETGDFRNWMEDLQDSRAMTVDPASGEPRCALGDLHKLPVLKYMLVPKNAARDRDAAYVEAKIKQIKDIHAEHSDFARKEFQEHMAHRKQGEMGLSLDKQREKGKDKCKKTARAKALGRKAREDRNSSSMREVARVPRSLQLTSQRFAVIIVLTDVTPDTLAGRDDPEPAIMVMDAFESCEDAEAYAETLQHHIYSVNIDVVEMYVWLHPEDVDYDGVREKYRHSEQNLIMQDKKKKKKELAQAEAEARRKNKPLPVSEVTAHSAAPKDFNPLKQDNQVTFEASDQPLDKEALQRESTERWESMTPGEREECIRFATEASAGGLGHVGEGAMP